MAGVGAGGDRRRYDQRLYPWWWLAPQAVWWVGGGAARAGLAWLNPGVVSDASFPPDPTRTKSICYGPGVGWVGLCVGVWSVRRWGGAGLAPPAISLQFLAGEEE